MAKHDSLEYWMSQLIGRSQSTKRNYLGCFKRFCEWMQKSPNELIELQKESGKHTGDKRDNMILETKVKTYIAFLSETKKPATARLSYHAIRSFFDSNFYPLHLKRGDAPKGPSRGSRIPSKTEVIKILNNCKTRKYRAVILALKDSGLRASDLTQLRWSDRIEFDEGFWCFPQVETKKRKVLACSFLGPESVEALQEIPRKNEKIFNMTSDTLLEVVNDIIRDSGLDTRGGKITCHSLRKYFNASLQVAGVSLEYRQAMMGKSAGISVYEENRPEQLFEVYKKNYDSLRVIDGGSTAIKNKVERIERENEKLRTAVIDLQTKMLMLAELGLEIRNGDLKIKGGEAFDTDKHPIVEG